MEHFYHQINGYFNYETVYDDFLQTCPQNAQIVEIGVWQGKSVCYAAVESIRRDNKVIIHAVDTFEGSPNEPQILSDLQRVRDEGNTVRNIFLHNIEPVKDIINLVHMDSISASKLYADRSLDMVYIDGSHLYKSVYNDIQAWLPKVKIGSMIAGHDIDGPEDFNGVRQAVVKFFGDDFTVINHGWASSWIHHVK